MTERTPRLFVEESDGATVVTFSDTDILDSLVVKEIQDELLNLVEELSRRKLVLDFADVRMLSSSMLGVLIRVHHRIVAARGRLALCKIADPIAEVFRITNLDKVFQIFRNREQALAAIK
jgi:anti-sigma B factor antagonist